MNLQGQINPNATQPAPPMEQLNNIAADAIDILYSAMCNVSVISDRLFISDNAKTCQTAVEPINLEMRLGLIRSMSQELNGKLVAIQNRL